ncbi:DUF4189 domain-containing protein [Nocardia acidivorans]|uniref:DUF4189 domain-containing protein n=1 Tax=Nocardia acidivorans TaxID=404580 RepID=UPI00082D2C19|nr:DUF4189 domain-containing protein [Nocardia acidivorans]
MRSLFTTKAVTATLTMTALGFAGLVVPAQANASGTSWGAIAVSDEGNWHASWNYSTKEDAKSEALNRCNGHNCEVLVAFTDCGSISYSRSQHQYVGRYGATREEAEDRARVAFDSEIIKTVCND